MFAALALVCVFLVQFAARNWIRECLKSPPVRPYEISVEQKVLWTFLFGTMLFIAIVGNSIVIWIVLGKFSLSCHLTLFSFSPSIPHYSCSSLHAISFYMNKINISRLVNQTNFIHHTVHNPIVSARSLIFRRNTNENILCRINCRR